MLIKSLFNLETNSTAKLPNQYFAMLEKEQKYKQLTERVSKINLFQQNFIQCMSTIKLTLIQLINEFFKPSEDSILKNIEHALLISFDTVNQICLNLSLKVENRLSNYQNEIANLSKKYKEQLQQMVHYQKKVQSIKKSFIQTREDKQRLERNIDKKRGMQKECRKTQKLLVQNYEIFQVQVQKLLDQCPQQILFQFIEGNFLSHLKLIQAVGQQKHPVRNRLRQCSIISNAMSDISDLQGSDKVSQYSDDDFNHQDQIQIIIEPQSSQTMRNGSEIIEININQETSDGHNYLQISNPNKYDEKIAKKLKRSLLRKASIEHKIQNKQNYLQKIKHILGFQNRNLKHQTLLNLDKAFQNLPSPVSQQNRRRKIFQSVKNKYSQPNKKIKIQKIGKLQKTVVNTKDASHQRSFILSKQEFQKDHSPSHRKKMRDKGFKVFVRNEQTLNNLPQNDESSQSTSKNQEKSSQASLSSIMQRKNHGPKREEQHSKKSSQTKNYLKTQPAEFIIKQNFCNQQKKVSKQRRQSSKVQHETFQPRQHAVSSYQCRVSNDLNNQSIGNIEEIKLQNKLGQNQKKRVMEQLFSVTALKNKRNQNEIVNSQLQKKQMYLTTDNCRQRDSKNWFSTNFLYPQNNNNYPQTIKNQNIYQVKELQNSQRQKIKSTKLPQVQNKVDFSIFSKIV